VNEHGDHRRQAIGLDAVSPCRAQTCDAAHAG
jgi:hypothetical protein